MKQTNLYEKSYDRIIYHFPTRHTEKLGNILSCLPIRAGTKDERLSVNVLGKKFSNPLIMASGYCHSARMLESALKLGAGGVTTKSITVNPNKGNPHPRVWRYKGGLINNVGLANKGVKNWVEELKKLRYGRVVGSVAGKTVQEFNYLYNKIEGLVDLVEFNFSCPNVDKGISSYEVIEEVVEGKKGYLIKIGPDHDLTRILDLEVEGGFTAINTFHGVSGKAIYDKSLETVRMIKENVESPIIGTGGVDTPRKAWEMILNGASCVGLLTGFITKGPYIFERVNKKLVGKLEENNFQNLEEAVGYAIK
jgi:dihydroorotate dehydrogenase (NAD+) catalytic subunit